MALARTSSQLYEELRKLIDLPKHAISVDIHLAVDEVATVVVKTHVEPRSAEDVPTLGVITKRYRLEEIKD